MIYQPTEDGQGLVEYGLVLVLIAIAVVALVTVFGSQLKSQYSRIISEFP
jgi:pilus assembly protein Flp/PilA